MRLVIMQPYLFPYMGYFQLLQAADRFVVYDDVSYIKSGWINRNRLLVNGAAHYFTVPLGNASSFRPIREVVVSPGGGWQDKLLKTFAQAYARAPHVAEVYPMIERVLAADEPLVARLAVASVRAVAEYLGLPTPLIDSSARYANAELKASERVLDICRQEGADVYLNAIGGQALYDRQAFAARGVDLRFLQPNLAPYEQFGAPFVPGLSILDALMFNSREAVRGFLRSYELV